MARSGEIETLTWTFVEDDAVQPPPGQDWGGEPRLVDPYALLPVPMAAVIRGLARIDVLDEAHCRCDAPIGWGVDDDGYPARRRFDPFAVVMNVSRRAWAVCEGCACALDGTLDHRHV